MAADGGDVELLGQVVGFYHQALKASPDALGYLQRRRIAHPEALERFRLGVSDRSLGYRLPGKNRKEGAELRGRLQALGVLRPSGHEHFAGSLVIPVAGLDGTVSEVYGRKLRDDLRPGTPKHLYLPGPHRGVEPRSFGGVHRGHRVRVADRRVEPVVRRVPSRHRPLRGPRASPPTIWPPCAPTASGGC